LIQYAVEISIFFVFMTLEALLRTDGEEQKFREGGAMIGLGAFLSCLTDPANRIDVEL
jgi:hypothetical protein